MRIRVKAPGGKSRIQYGHEDSRLGFDTDGSALIPSFALPELLAAGCTLVDPDPGPIDARALLAAAPADEVGFFLRARGVSTNKTVVLAPAIINGIAAPQRPQSVMRTEEENRAAALALFDAEAAAISH